MAEGRCEAARGAILANLQPDELVSIVSFDASRIALVREVAAAESVTGAETTYGSLWPRDGGAVNATYGGSRNRLGRPSPLVGPLDWRQVGDEQLKRRVGAALSYVLGAAP